MKMILKISWRNVWRNPSRSTVIIASILIGLWGGIFAASIMFGLIQQRFSNGIEKQISHIQIHNPEFLQEYLVEYEIDNHEGILEAISNDANITAYSARTLLSGMLSTANMTRGVSIFGIDPEAEAKTTQFDGNILEGDYFEEDSRNPIIIGQKLAEKIKAGVGSRVVITFQGFEGEIVSASFRVRGIYRSFNTALDGMNVYVQKTNLAHLLDDRVMVNEIAILANDIDQVNDIADQYKEAYPKLTVRTWAEISPELAYMHQMATVMLMIILAIILGALAFGLLNTMLMSVFERTRELGMLMSVGMNKSRVFLMILFETSFLTFMGAILGMILSAATILIFRNTGLDLAVVGGDTLNEFGYESMIYPALNSKFYMVLTILVILTAILSAIYPALKALKLKPAEAVRKE